jgi:hypothetical protein
MQTKPNLGARGGHFVSCGSSCATQPKLRLTSCSHWLVINRISLDFDCSIEKTHVLSSLVDGHQPSPARPLEISTVFEPLGSTPILSWTPACARLPFLPGHPQLESFQHRLSPPPLEHRSTAYCRADRRAPLCLNHFDGGLWPTSTADLPSDTDLLHSRRGPRWASIRLAVCIYCHCRTCMCSNLLSAEPARSHNRAPHARSGPSCPSGFHPLNCICDIDPSPDARVKNAEPASTPDLVPNCRIQRPSSAPQRRMFCLHPGRTPLRRLRPNATFL